MSDLDDDGATCAELDCPWWSSHWVALHPDFPFADGTQPPADLQDETGSSTNGGTL